MRANLTLKASSRGGWIRAKLPAAAVIRSGGEAGGGRGLGPMTALLLKRAPASRTRPSGENRTSSLTLLLDRTWNEISIHHVILDFLRAERRRFLSRNRPFRDGHHSDRSHKSDILVPLRSLELTAKELPTIECADCTFVFPH
jgi:hypothetical protein